MINFSEGIVSGDYVYDIETYKDAFTMVARHVDSDLYHTFEISRFKNEFASLKLFINELNVRGCRMIGYNSIGFDYPVLHKIIKSYVPPTSEEIHAIANDIINTPFERRFDHIIWPRDQLVYQVDLLKVHHFDNLNRATRLKDLEFNMRMSSIADLPYAPDADLDRGMIDNLIKYNKHDVDATWLFYHQSTEQLEFREKLSVDFGKDFTNHNDTKIGKDYFIMKLEESAPGSCYYYDKNNKRQLVQTHRNQIALKDVILSVVKFETPGFQSLLSRLQREVITETKGVFTDMHVTHRGFQFDFGTGGIHGSLNNVISEDDDEYAIIDIDVTSYYPTLAIANDLYPEHLGREFCDRYLEVFNMRKAHSKKESPVINEMLKLALNGVYGDSNNKYSPFYDPQYTMAITINGQLLLCMLAEQLMKSPQLQLLQINTDGMTFKVKRDLVSWVKDVCVWWESLTGLQLEEAHYSKMCIRDVNNYVAVGTDGKIKLKGAYEYDVGWHQDHSHKAVAKAAVEHLVNGANIDDYIHKHSDIYDFFIKVKVPRSAYLEFNGSKVDSIVRYLITPKGGTLTKVMPPKGELGTYKRRSGLSDQYYREILEQVGDEWDERIHTKNKSVHAERRIGVNTGWRVTLYQDVPSENVDDYDIDYEWYISEAKKLTESLCLIANPR